MSLKTQFFCQVVINFSKFAFWEKMDEAMDGLLLKWLLPEFNFIRA